MRGSGHGREFYVRHKGLFEADKYTALVRDKPREWWAPPARGGDGSDDALERRTLHVTRDILREGGLRDIGDVDVAGAVPGNSPFHPASWRPGAPTVDSLADWTPKSLGRTDAPSGAGATQAEYRVPLRDWRDGGELVSKYSDSGGRTRDVAAVAPLSSTVVRTGYESLLFPGEGRVAPSLARPVVTAGLSLNTGATELRHCRSDLLRKTQALQKLYNTEHGGLTVDIRGCVLRRLAAYEAIESRRDALRRLFESDTATLRDTAL